MHTCTDWPKWCLAWWCWWIAEKPGSASLHFLLDDPTFHPASVCIHKLWQCMWLIEINEKASIFDAVLLWTRLDGGERNNCSWDLCRYLIASVLCGGCRLRNGGQEVEESGLIIPTWPSHQIPSSAGHQLSWFCQFTVISHSQRQLDQDCVEDEFVHTLLAAAQSLIDRPVIFFPIRRHVSCQSLLNHAWVFSLYSKTAVGKSKGGLSV